VTLLPDALGSTSATVASGASAPQATYGYTPHGASSSSLAGDTNPVRFTGRTGAPELPGGLQDNRHRMYDPATGRFLSSDPIGMASGSSNTFSYAGNDPVDFTDPMGTDLLGGCLVGAAIGVGGELLSGRKHTLESIGTSALEGCVIGVVASTVPFLLGEVMALGEAGAAAEAVAGEEITIYRGTANVAENRIIDETGMSMSEAARAGYEEGGQSIEAAQAASEAAHAEGVASSGSESAYAEAHSTDGIEFGRAGNRSMISFTEDINVARRFANHNGANGTIYQATVRAGQFIRQTLPGSTECEILIRHMIPVSPWGG
jgi:RHS repeat-associated protein